MRPQRFPFGKPTWPAGVTRPTPARRLGLDYDHGWSRRYPVRLARAVVLDDLVRPVARLIAPTTVRGVEHLRHLTAPVIFVADHSSHFDTPLLLTTLPVEFRHRTVVAAAADYFFDRHWKAALWSVSLALIPIERGRVNRRSADVAAELVREGWNLVIFPEGGRSPDGWAQPFRGGAAYLARRTGRAVVPVHLDGTRHVLPKTGARRLPRRSPVSVVFGAPLTPDEGEDARRFAARIEAAVAILADEVASDWWSARKRAALGGTPALGGPEVSGWRRSWALSPAPEIGRDTWPRV
ncbi:MAG: lysophospholipid acyltransferase family protein [Acidimicrobiales bacterium]